MKRAARWGALAFALAGGLVGCKTTPKGPVPVTLVYSGNVDGEIEPCG